LVTRRNEDGQEVKKMSGRVERRERNRRERRTDGKDVREGEEGHQTRKNREKEGKEMDERRVHCRVVERKRETTKQTSTVNPFDFGLHVKFREK
jgi:hypothetical protein